MRFFRGGASKGLFMHNRFDFCILGGAVDIYVIDIQIIRIDLPCGFTPIPASAPLIDMI